MSIVKTRKLKIPRALKDRFLLIVDLQSMFDLEDRRWGFCWHRRFQFNVNIQRNLFFVRERIFQLSFDNDSRRLLIERFNLEEMSRSFIPSTSIRIFHPTTILNNLNDSFIHSSVSIFSSLTSSWFRCLISSINLHRSIDPSLNSFTRRPSTIPPTPKSFRIELKQMEFKWEVRVRSLTDQRREEVNEEKIDRNEL